MVVTFSMFGCLICGAVASPIAPWRLDGRQLKLFCRAGQSLRANKVRAALGDFLPGFVLRSNSLGQRLATLFGQLGVCAAQLMLELMELRRGSEMEHDVVQLSGYRQHSIEEMKRRAAKCAGSGC
jgi:hypothetical protein